MKDKLNIALLMGGDSGEFDVSIGSAGVIRKHLNTFRYLVYPILVRDNTWNYQNDEGETISVDKNDFSLSLKSGKIKFDCAFIAIHGTPGEDGKLQGYLDMIGVPYTSCDLTTSAITFNKYFCNDLALQYGMNVAKTCLIEQGDDWNGKELIDSVGLPCFVKPNKSGSSVGVSKVYEMSELKAAVEKAFNEDDEVLVQQFISGREMACGVFLSSQGIKVLPVTEIISKKDFFDYEAKYTSGMAEEITPANISDNESIACHDMTSFLYKKFKCKGVVRFDYFLSDNKWWFLEVNTVPGFSEGSIIPKQARTAGFTLSDFFAELIEQAIK
ncbi:MAG: D-alanine--D-alanine ligase [Bacteroidetes bacterium]|nr:D-alanine--D-alanine ligase [Bacteroidota bacterium]